MIPIVAAIAIAFVLKTFIIANAKVPTGSMIATINVDDRIIASRLAYRTDTPSRYDIILFYYPDDENDVFVKRVLGLPGETLEVVDGVVYITTKDGKTIQTEQSFVNPAEVPTGDFGPYYIPEKGEKISVDGNYCFAENGVMMGQRSFIDKYCTLTPQGDYVISENLYFMMGDNRNNSHDSRGWTNQFVSEDKIIGKVLFKYYPQFEKIQ
ncbi:MAG: signal peptidase I [Eubacterium sp.]|nr:signal peptidase I [Eubacterium sp.]